jgi:acyl-ACP thioesterase
MESVIRLDEVVENKERKFGSNLQYFPVKVIDIDGNEHNALFTADQIEIATKRADENPEDMPEDKKGWWPF